MKRRVLMFICCLGVAAASPMAHAESAPTMESAHEQLADLQPEDFPSDQEIDAAFDKYVNTNTGKFDIQSALAAKEDPAIIEIAKIYNQAIEEYEECMPSDADDLAACRENLAQ